MDLCEEVIKFIGTSNSFIFHRLFTETNWLQEEVPLPKPTLSIYPAFVDNTNLMMVDEDHRSEQPTIVVYSIAMFIPGVTAEEENL